MLDRTFEYADTFGDFTPAQDDRAPLTIAVSFAGGSGTGKTYSALRLARGIAGNKPFGFIDTENRRALHYRAEFPEMRHLDFSPIFENRIIGFPPERWIAAINAAEKAGLPVVVIDSFSHAWEGIGGVLEMQEAALDKLVDESAARRPGALAPDRDKFSQLAWASVKPRYRRLLERIIRAKCHVVMCIRAKPVMQAWNRDAKKMQNARATKLRRNDLPWDIAADRDLVFEMTASFLMDPDKPGVPIVLKCADAFKGIFAQGRMIDEAAGRAMHQWSIGEDEETRANKRLLDTARDEARKGQAAFTEWWKGIGKPDRALVNTIVEECKKLCAEADARTRDDTPFGEEDGGPSCHMGDAEADRIAVEARAETDRLAQEQA